MSKGRVEQQERASQKSGESAGSGLVSGRHGQAAETYAARKSARTARLDAMRSESERTERRDRIGDAGDSKKKWVLRRMMWRIRGFRKKCFSNKYT